ncbi:MAG: AAA family ATPase, partial [Erysipelotrichaceae bacterium]|nr:AAA family ATPase [Erysipelotrichaceae bacterium]
MKIFKRKAYQSLLEWKNKYSNNYACLLEGARRVGKSTLAEEFAKNEFRSYIRVDFSDITNEMLEIFDDIANLNYFFLRLQAMTNVTLYEKESVIIFDEIQLCPKVRQAVKHLVKDGRYFYIETGSLLSIKQNVQSIVIPSEEHKISIHPLDYEEFLWATGENSELLKEIAKKKIPLGNGVNRRLMKSFRLYIAVGGMPQA